MKSRHKGKLETEAYLKQIGIPFTSIRPTYIYGPMNYNPLGMTYILLNFRYTDFLAFPTDRGVFLCSPQRRKESLHSGSRAGAIILSMHMNIHADTIYTSNYVDSI